MKLDKSQPYETVLKGSQGHAPLCIEYTHRINGLNQLNNEHTLIFFDHSLYLFWLLEYFFLTNWVSNTQFC